MLSYSSGRKKPKIRLSGIKPRFLQDYPSSRASEKGCGNCRYFSVMASLFRPDLAFHCPISFLPLRLWSHHLCWLWPSCTALISDLFGSLGPIQIGQDNFSNSRSWAKAQLQIPFCSTESSAHWGLGLGHGHLGRGHHRSQQVEAIITSFLTPLFSVLNTVLSRSYIRVCVYIYVWQINNT